MTSSSSHEQLMTGETKDGPSGARMQRLVDAPFDLRVDYLAMNNADHMAFFNSTFPGNKGYSFDGLFLHIFLHCPHPSVQCFAGVPVIFVSPQNIADGFPSPMPYGFPGTPGQGSIAHDLNFRDHPGEDPHWQPLFDAIRSHFETSHVSITEVIFWGYFIQIVLRDTDTDRAILPLRAGGLMCRYLYETEMGRPATLQSETRNRNPNEGQGPDNTEYEVLRPGVRVSSDFLPGTEVYRSSTLGARVHDANGNVFVTVAAHTFPDDNAVVFHPLRPSGRPIGQLSGRVGTTDVALLSLDPQQRFSNEIFISTSYDKDDASPQIQGMREAKRYDVVTLDAPDTGVLYGSVMAFSKRCLSGVEGDTETYWVDISYIYVGENNDDILPDRMCGAVVRSNDQKIVSFFQYQIINGRWKGWCTGTSSSELLKRGYS